MTAELRVIRAGRPRPDVVGDAGLGPPPDRFESLLERALWQELRVLCPPDFLLWQYRPSAEQLVILWAQWLRKGPKAKPCALLRQLVRNYELTIERLRAVTVADPIIHETKALPPTEDETR